MRVQLPLYQSIHDVTGNVQTTDGRKIHGYAIYNLYQRTGETDVSDLIQDFPVDFFAAVEVLQAGIIILSPELQKKGVEFLTKYNAVSEIITITPDT